MKEIINNIGQEFISNLSNLRDKQFWISRLTSLTWVDKLLLLYITADHVNQYIKKVKKNRLVVKQFEHMVSLEDATTIFNEFLSAVSGSPDMSTLSDAADTYYENDELTQLISLLCYCDRFREHFQRDTAFVLKLWQQLRYIDEKLKIESIQTVSWVVPIYIVNDQVKGTNPSITVLLKLRSRLIEIVLQLTKKYANVPYSVVKSIVDCGSNQNATYGLRRFMTTTILYNLRDSKQNCITLCQANAVTLLKFYDMYLYKGRTDEQLVLQDIFKTIGRTNIDLRQLSNKEEMLVRNLLKETNQNQLNTQIFTTFCTTLFSYYKTRNYTTAITTGVMDWLRLAISERLNHNFIYYIGSMYATALLMPYWKQTFLAKNIGYMLGSFYNGDVRQTLSKEDSAEYSPMELDQMIPSIDLIYNFNNIMNQVEQQQQQQQD